MSRLYYSPAAQADLDGIWTYTTERWGQAQAITYVRELAAACRGLADGAKPSRPIDDIRAGYRKALVRSHVIYFITNDAGETVIIRILHGRMDVEHHLDPGSDQG